MKNDSVQPIAKYLKDYTKPNFLVDSIELTVELDDHRTQVTSKVNYKKHGQDNILQLDGAEQKLLSIAMDGDVLMTSQYSYSDGTLTITDVPDSFELTITSEIDPANNSSLEGLYKSGGMFCTQCEAEGFRKITFYPDRPDVLATFTTHIIADAKQYPCLLSNGNKISEQVLDNGKTKVTWHDPFKKPAYLFALVAGDLDVLSDSYTTQSGRDVVLEIFVDKGNLSRAPFAMESLKKSMQWDEQRFDLEYDLDIYMIVAVDFFNMGAMENKGLNIFNSKCVLADQKSATDADFLRIESIVGHEYFHNWTGNRVTCRDWFQLSLKEGLTVFRDQEFSMDLGSRAANRIDQVKVMREYQFAEDAGPMSHPIRPESVIEMSNFYTVTVYDKGAEVIRMMHAILGEHHFQKGMKLYFERHDGQAVTCDDFVAAMQDASGIDLSLFKGWYRQSGTPTLTAEVSYQADSQQLDISLSQQTEPTADQTEKQALDIPVSIAVFDSSGQPIAINEGSNEAVLRLQQSQQTFSYHNITSNPVVSLLRDFSAPVKLQYQQQDSDIALLIAAETSHFTKWELMQNLLSKHLLLRIYDANHQYPQVIVEALSAVLSEPTADQQLVAEMLKQPGFATLLEQAKGVDVQIITDAQDDLARFIAQELESQLSKLVEDYQDVTYQFNGAAIARRALVNAALNLLAHLSSAAINDKIKAHYQQADNMTDALGALNAALEADENLFNALISDFENKWRGDNLVMDKFFSLQARRQTGIQTVLTQMTEHPDFDIQNPNKVRALYGAFAMSNTKQFHKSDGSGYIVLTDLLLKLNDINPQSAARLITPLIQFNSLDNNRQVLIKAQLQRLAQVKGLSVDLYEKVSKALA